MQHKLVHFLHSPSLAVNLGVCTIWIRLGYAVMFSFAITQPIPDDSLCKIFMSEPSAKKQKTKANVQIPSAIKLQEKFMVEQRRHFHQHPELSFQEVETAKHIAGILRKWGLTVYEKIGRTGVVGVLKGGKGEGPCVMLRADMDALPLQEIDSSLNGSYKSKVKDVMHACGHDGHMAILLGACKALVAVQNQLKGHVKFCFQPAEEGYGGAKVMIED
eukprot:g81355.t1